MSNNEEEYFRREEAEKLHRLAKDKDAAMSESDLAERKKAHFMKCGKCGSDLQTIKWRKVEIERCFACGVTLLDDGELEKLAGEEDDTSIIGELFGLFKA